MGHPVREPQAILAQRMVRKGQYGATELKIQWYGLPATAATWEDNDDVVSHFLHLDP